MDGMLALADAAGSSLLGVAVAVVTAFGSLLAAIIVVVFRTGRILERVESHHERTGKLEERVDAIDKRVSEHSTKWRVHETLHTERRNTGSHLAVVKTPDE